MDKEEALQTLLRASYGDYMLIERALKQIIGENSEPNLADVVAYIMRHRVRPHWAKD